MQFKGVNAVGFGDYADGFAPSCPVTDDLTRQRGDPVELMLAGALTFVPTGACPGRWRHAIVVAVAAVDCMPERSVVGPGSGTYGG